MSELKRSCGWGFVVPMMRGAARPAADRAARQQIVSFV